MLADYIARFPSGLATGDGGWTTAGDMPARWVIHTIGPNYGRGEIDASARLLLPPVRRSRGRTRSTDRRVSPHQRRQPHWPHDDAVHVALETLRDTASDVREARIVAFNPATLASVQTLL